MNLRSKESGAGESRLRQSSERSARLIRCHFEEMPRFLFDLVLHVGRRSFRHDPTRIHQREVIAMFSLAHIVGGDQNRDALFSCQSGQNVPEVPTADRIDAGSRFIEKQHTWLMDKRAAERQTLAHAHRQATGQIRLVACQAPPCDMIHVKPLLRGLAVQPVDPGKEADVLLHGQVQIQRKGLGHVADPFLDRSSGGLHIRPRHPPCSSSRRHDAVQHLDHGRFPRTVGTEQAEDLSWFDLKTDAIHRAKCAEIANEPPRFDGQPMSSISLAESPAVRELSLTRRLPKQGARRTHPPVPAHRPALVPA